MIFLLHAMAALNNPSFRAMLMRLKWIKREVNPHCDRYQNNVIYHRYAY